MKYALSIGLILVALVGCDDLVGQQDTSPNRATEGPVTDVVDVALIPAPAARLGQDLDARIEASEQILHGTVVDIAYASSADLGEDTLSFPHTFVTFSVQTAIKGGTVGEDVTLRFAGGPVGSDRMMTSAHIPLFDIGHEVVLFAAENTVSACPLVGNLDGLVRISEGHAYSQDGTELFVDGEDLLRSGRVQDIPEANVFHVNGQRFELNATLWDEDFEIDSPGAMRATAFISWLQDQVERVHTAAELDAQPTIVQADPDAVFTIARPQDVAPAASMASPVPVEPDMSERDRAELEALQANDMNPVLD